MSTMMNLWISWSYYFNGLPFSDYAAAFALVGLVIFVAKRVKAAMRYV